MAVEGKKSRNVDTTSLGKIQRSAISSLTVEERAAGAGTFQGKNGTNLFKRRPGAGDWPGTAVGRVSDSKSSAWPLKLLPDLSRERQENGMAKEQNLRKELLDLLASPEWRHTLLEIMRWVAEQDCPLLRSDDDEGIASLRRRR